MIVMSAAASVRPARLLDAPAAHAAWPLLLPFGVYVLHTLEELPGFAA
ncbi:hypothetical protein [Microtetraspora malaysiensis]|uniref:Uncharacterized protein n=2 Tax=Microtetraspora malaysiensis TaxID=161358 RepID=A0ABW6SZ91_9ACTN